MTKQYLPHKEFTGMQLIDIYNDVWVATLADRIDPPPARTKEEIFRKILDSTFLCILLHWDNCNSTHCCDLADRVSDIVYVPVRHKI